MFGLGLPELCVSAGILVFILGGKRVASLGKGMGEGINGFLDGFRTAKKAARELEKERLEPLDDE